jgi:hypothetical protein
VTWTEYGLWPGVPSSATQVLSATAPPGGTFEPPVAAPGTLKSRGPCVGLDLTSAPAGTAVLLLECQGARLARAH